MDADRVFELMSAEYAAWFENYCAAHLIALEAGAGEGLFVSRGAKPYDG
ncbi:MAG: hypothetical protein GXY52_04760 [Chloroflexi bacterium]|nr:hypothetical protein [Chloroflexota bacterium]